MDTSNWHPIAFQRDAFATRGWGTLIESVSSIPISFEALVARYNWLLLEHQMRQIADNDQRQALRELEPAEAFALAFHPETEEK